MGLDPLGLAPAPVHRREAGRRGLGNSGAPLVAGTLAAGMVVGAGVIVTRSLAAGKENRAGQKEQ